MQGVPAIVVLFSILKDLTTTEKFVFCEKIIIGETQNNFPFFFWDPFFQSTWAYLILLHLIFLFHVYRQTFTHFRTAHTHILRKKKSDKQEEEGEKKLNLSFIDLSHKAIFTHPCCCQLATFAFRWPYCSHFYCFFPIFRFNCTYTYIFADCTQSIW